MERVFLLDRTKVFQPRPRAKSSGSGTPRQGQAERETGNGAASAEGAAALPLSKAHIKPAVPVPSFEYCPDGGLVKVRIPSKKKGVGGKRGKCVGFTRGARSRMMELTNRLRRYKDDLPFFITLTLPGRTEVKPAQMQRAFAYLMKSFIRRFPCASAIWRREIKARLSGIFKDMFLPHYHLLGFGLSDRIGWQPYKGKWVEVRREGQGYVTEIWYVENGERKSIVDQAGQHRAEDKFAHWLARMWYEFIGSGELNHYEVTELPKSCQQVEFYEGVRRYVSKYCTKEETWGPEWKGKSWGTWNRKHLPLSETVREQADEDVAIRMARYLRKRIQSSVKLQRVKRAMEKAGGKVVSRDRGAYPSQHPKCRQPVGRTLFCNQPEQWNKLYEYEKTEAVARTERGCVSDDWESRTTGRLLSRFAADHGSTVGRGVDGGRAHGNQRARSFRGSREGQPGQYVESDQRRHGADDDQRTSDRGTRDGNRGHPPDGTRTNFADGELTAKPPGTW